MREENGDEKRIKWDVKDKDLSRHGGKIEEREREREGGKKERKKKERCETRKIAAPSEIQRLQDSFVVVKELKKKEKKKKKRKKEHFFSTKRLILSNDLRLSNNIPTGKFSLFFRIISQFSFVTNRAIFSFSSSFFLFVGASSTYQSFKYI